MRKALLLPVVIIMIGLGSCLRSNLVSVKSTNFTDEISQLQNLEFEFNHEIVGDSMLNVWDTTPYIEFKPAIRGKFRWESPTLLVFSPYQEMLPAQDYTATLTKELNKHSKKKRNISSENIEFHTPYLSISSFTSYWTVSDLQLLTTELRVSFELNYYINITNLKDLITLKLKGKQVDFDLVTNQNSNIIELNIPKPEGAASDVIPGTITIAPGVKCAKSSSVSKKPIEYNFEIPRQDQLSISEIQSGYEGGTGYIRVFTSQPLVNQNIKSLITIYPTIEFSAQTTENGILVKADFLEANTYSIVISGKIKGIFGKELGENYQETVKFGELEPYISFTDKNAIYLSSKGSRNIAINIINVSKIKLTVFKVFENNIIHYMHEGKDWDYYSDEEEWYSYTNYNTNERYGKVLVEKDILTGSLKKRGNTRLLNIDLNDLDLKSELKGLYVIKVESANERWLTDSRIVSVSDIGLIAKKGINHLFVMTNSIKTANPLSGVKINIISSNNQKLVSLTTNSKGIAMIDDLKTAMPGFEVGMITASVGNDFNYMLLNNSRVEDSRFEIGGKRTEDIDYDVFVYGPRNLYRPGDSVYYNVIVRDFDWKTKEGIPVKAKVILPTGKEFLSFRKEVNSQGTAQFAFRINPGLITGIYTFEVYSGNDVLLQSSRFSVEEFMPDRIKVKVSIPKEVYKPAETLKAKITATNMFGPPAANRNMEITMSLSRKALYPKNLPDYNFTIDHSDLSYFPETVNEGKTSETGTAEISFKVPEYRNIGILQGNIYTTVFDETGRPVNRYNSFELQTQNVFFGIKKTDTWISTRRASNIGIVAIDKNGKILSNIKAKIQIRRVFWETVMERSGSRYYYNSQKRENLIVSKNIILNGKCTYGFTPNFSGEYEVRIMPEEGAGYVKRTFYAYGYGDTDYSSFEVSKEGEITIETDKTSYSVGETAKILFKAPFSGKIVVTVEKNKVTEQFFLTTDNKAATLTIPLTEKHLPNVYVSATAIRELKDDGIPLTVAHGVCNIPVTNPAKKLNVEIIAGEKVRSKTKQTIRIKTAPNSRVTIAVVDEGILTLNNYKTPDPFEYFYGKRALEVSSYDIYAQLYPELKTGSSKTGGGGPEGLGKRINPFTSKRVKLISLWSGEKVANANGECTFTANIPQFSGAVRIMAAAYKNDCFGSAEKEMKIADPIVISVALPRFLSPGDKISVPVTLTNTTAKTSTAEVTFSVKGPLQVNGINKQSVSVKANAEGQTTFLLDVPMKTGYGTVMVSVGFNGETFTDETEISVRPSAGLSKKSGVEIVKGGSVKSFSILSDFIPGTTTAKIVISKSPIVAFTKDISYLLEYPYGCLEQTISTAFPQIYYRELAMAINSKPRGSAMNPDYNVQEAIGKIQSQQLYNGGISMWPGSEDPSWWGSIYAAHFLYEARKAGFDVNKAKYELLLHFIEKRAKDKATEITYYYDASNTIQNNRLAARETFYSLFVLALNGKANQSLMNYYKAHLDELTTDSRYMLSAAFNLIGDKVAYLAVLPKDFGNFRSVCHSGGNFYSYVRDVGLSLYTLLEADPQNSQIPLLAKRLSEQMNLRTYLSTQERIFAFLSLGKIAMRAAEAKITATVVINGKEQYTFTGKDLVINKTTGISDVKITTAGTGNLYCFYQIEGISSSGINVEEDNSLQVRKSFYDRSGKLLAGTSFSRNDLVVVEITIKTKDNSFIDNVAITDILPACFEIENPRLNAARDFPWINNKSTPEYLDIRDDRINFFTSVSGSYTTFYYTVRVVSPGTFKMGSVCADAMYNGDYHSYWGARTLTVK